MVVVTLLPSPPHTSVLVAHQVEVPGSRRRLQLELAEIAIMMVSNAGRVVVQQEAVQHPLAGHADLHVLQLNVVQVVDRLHRLHQPVVGNVVL